MIQMENSNITHGHFMTRVFAFILVVMLIGTWVYVYNVTSKFRSLDSAENLDSVGNIRAIIVFQRLLIQSVLIPRETEITIDERLALEEAVRVIGDEEILSTWNRFLESSPETAQGVMTDLLFLLTDAVNNKL